MPNKRDNSNMPLFIPLTSISHADIGFYKDALDYVFSHNEVRNIALSGPYGSGKSSVIKTYEKQTKKEFLYVSLAHFSPQNDKLNTLNISVLEWKIINQLIHQINPEKIPQTNFQIKRSITKLGKCGLIKVSVMILAFISSFLHTALFYRWVNFYDTLNIKLLKCILCLTTYSDFRLVTLLICIVLAGVGIFKLLLFQRDRRIIKKVKFKDAEIEMFDGNDESYFDKYLNEVLYLFDNTDQKVIIFEDMDRFDNNVIFERLREINTLINNSKEINKQPIRFFYLIRDDIFTNKDRTKFFDLIIPVVPVIDGSNSYDKFIEKLKEYGIFEHFDSSFIQGFSLYIDEMRLLLNICNEYQVYYRQLEKAETKIDHNKMLAMIAYKNLFPYDFAQLQLGQGFVFELINSKNEMITNEKNRLENDIAALKTEMECAKKEHLKSEKEVDILYSDRFSSLSGIFVTYYNEVRKDSKYPPEKAIAARKANIANRSNEASISEKIHELERQLIILRSNRIKDLLKRENVDEIFLSRKHINLLGDKDDLKNVKGSPYFSLLKFLIRNGHIDETYKDYMTYFYSNSLSSRDAAFCRSITDQKAERPEYKVDNPAMVIDKLPPEYFRQIEALNYSILDHLLAAKNPSEQLSLLIDQIIERKLYDFINGYFLNGNEIEKFVITANNIHPALFHELQSGKELVYQKLYYFVEKTFYQSSNEIVMAVNVEGCLTDFISNSTFFLVNKDPKLEFIIPRLKMLGVSFTAFDAEKANLELLQGIYENNLYKITFENLSIMLQKFYNIEVSTDFSHRNYTLILSNPDSPLALYINRNITVYIEEVLKNCRDEITDDEKNALSILNNETIQVDLKQKYILSLKTRLAELAKIDDKTLWADLIKTNDAITYSEKNVIDYFLYSGDIFDSTLIDWINKQLTQLDFSQETLFDVENDERDKFSDAVVQSNLLNDKKYSEFTASINREYNTFRFDSIENNKMNILIDNDIIKMSAENLKILRDKYSFEILCRYIVHKIDEYIKMHEVQGGLMSTGELEYIISTKSGVSEDQQLKLLQINKSALSIIGKSYSELIKLHILSHNFSEGDFEILINNYDSYSMDIRKMFINLSINRIEKIIENKYSISKTFFDDLVNDGRLNEEQKNRFRSYVPEYK